MALTLKKPKENQCFWLRTLKNLRKINVFALPEHLVTLGAPLGPPRPSSWLRRGEPRVGSAPHVGLCCCAAGSLAGIRFEMRGICNLLRLVESHPPFRREGTAHRQNLYTQTPDSPHACGQLVHVIIHIIIHVIIHVIIHGT